MNDWKVWNPQEARNFLPVPLNSDDKYSRGVLGLVAGSDEYPGSAVLSSKAALRTGIGMIRYFGTEKSQMLVLNSCPEVVIMEGQVQAWAIGSGVDPKNLDRAREAVIETALNQRTPVLLDAGALEFVGRFHGPTLITPHYRELARLFESTGVKVSAAEIKKDPRQWCRRAADELKVCVLLKGTVTFIAAPDHCIELPMATSWMATAGTGDVLAGIIGALMATQSDKILSEASSLVGIAATGALLHAQAADRASGGGPICASDIISEISNVIRDLLAT
ncbi:MAG: NAD(P)H-hydrate dehydratase [Actinobacteria bacterium]|nr:NAD(P)H-hydrate dehydratase [Actinomycetota bacterium]